MAEPPFDPADALALLHAQERRVRSALDPHLGEVFIAWGLAWLIGLGAIWWQVRGQHPYAGPSGLPAVLFGVLLAAAGGYTGWQTQRATSGLGGDAQWRGLLYGLGWLGGFVAFFGILGAAYHAGAQAPVMGVLGTCGPLAVVGLMYLFGAAAFGSRPMAALGGWLVLLATVAGFAGPVGVSGIGALLGGLGFLAAGVWTRQHRHAAS